MFPSEILDDVRDHLDAQDKFWTGAQLWRRIDSAYREIVRRILREDPTYFIETVTIDLVGGTGLYDLPLNARRGSRIVIAENLQSSPSSPIPPMIVQAFLDYQSGGLLNLSSGTHFQLENDQLRLAPAPANTATSGVKLYYGPSFGNLIQGEASAVSSTTITSFTGTPNYTTNYGVLDRRDDFYNGMSIQIKSGTGVGQTRTVSDYVGSSRQFTVDSAWTTTPVADDSVFAIMCPVPEDYHDVVSVAAALKASVKGRTRFADLQDLYHGHSRRSGMLSEMLAFIRERQVYRLHTVIPSDTGD